MKPAARFVSGILIGLSMATPVFAATPALDEWTSALALAGVILFVVGIVLKATSSGGSANRRALRAQRIDGRHEVLRDRD